MAHVKLGASLEVSLSLWTTIGSKKPAPKVRMSSSSDLIAQNALPILFFDISSSVTTPLAEHLVTLGPTTPAFSSFYCVVVRFVRMSAEERKDAKKCPFSLSSSLAADRKISEYKKDGLEEWGNSVAKRREHPAASRAVPHP